MLPGRNSGIQSCWRNCCDKHGESTSNAPIHRPDLYRGGSHQPIVTDITANKPYGVFPSGGGEFLHYDVLNHTDLSREGGQSGDIDLSHINWGNYDLVVIDDRLHGIEHHGSVRFAAIGRAYGTHA